MMENLVDKANELTNRENPLTAHNPKVPNPTLIILDSRLFNVFNSETVIPFVLAILYKVSPFLTDEEDALKLTTSAESLFSASSKEILVRVEGS